MFNTEFKPLEIITHSSLDEAMKLLSEKIETPLDLVFMNYDSSFVDLDDHGKLLLYPLEPRGDDKGGWIGAIPDQDIPEDEMIKVREILTVIATGINRETMMIHESDDLTTELSIRYEELNIIYDVGEVLKKYLRGEALYKTLMDLVIEHLDVDLAVFIHTDLDNPVYSLNTEKNFEFLDLMLTKMKGEIFRFVGSSKEPLTLNLIDDQRRDYLWVGMPTKILAAPILYKKKMKAMLVILRDTDRLDFSNSDRKLLEIINEQVGTLMRNEEMYDSLFVFTEQIALSMIEAVDAKDPYTRGHSDRVNYYAIQIGESFSLSEEDKTDLYWASLLHDIGKIGVPDLVLGKIGKLDDDEYTLIKIHPERGYDILKHVDKLRRSLPGIRHHHERFDGDGYPHGLKQKEIPLTARIIAVADTYDAMTSSRSYRPSRCHEEAMSEIKRVSGTQLDPDVVNAWVEITEKNPDVLTVQKTNLRKIDDRNL